MAHPERAGERPLPEEWEIQNAMAKAWNPRLGKKQLMLSTVVQLAPWGTVTTGDNCGG